MTSISGNYFRVRPEAPTRQNDCLIYHFGDKLSSDSHVQLGRQQAGPAVQWPNAFTKALITMLIKVDKAPTLDKHGVSTNSKPKANVKDLRVKPPVFLDSSPRQAPAVAMKPESNIYVRDLGITLPASLRVDGSSRQVPAASMKSGSHVDDQDFVSPKADVPKQVFPQFTSVHAQAGTLVKAFLKSLVFLKTLVKARYFDRVDTMAATLSKRVVAAMLVKRFRKAWQACYAACTTKDAIAAGAIGGAADMIVQVISNLEPYNYLRTMSFVIFGQFYCGGFQPHVYRGFDRWLGDDILRKLLLEFLIYATIVYIPSFYLITGMLQGLGWSEALASLSTNYVETVVSYFLIWPLPMFVYFRLVPEKARVLYICMFSFVEKMVYSFLAR